jgi:phosphoglycerate dehydrogenase-like enzyme
MSHPTPELTWGLIISLARKIPIEDLLHREGRYWQTTVGKGFHDKTLGIVGLRHLQRKVEEIGRAFGMNVIAWSSNLTEERAAEEGVKMVSKSALFSDSDLLRSTCH